MADKRYKVKYEITSGVDSHKTVVDTGEVTLSASSAGAARVAARNWVYDNDPKCDPRIDPMVRIIEVGRN